MAKLHDLKKFILSKDPTKVQTSKTTESEYFFFGSRCIRLSCHNNTHRNYDMNNLNIIVPKNENIFIVNFNYNAIVLTYVEIKRFIEAYLWGITTSFVNIPDTIIKPTHQIESLDKFKNNIAALFNDWGCIKNIYTSEIEKANNIIKSQEAAKEKNAQLIKQLRDLSAKLKNCKSQLTESEELVQKISSDNIELKDTIKTLSSENEALKNKFTLIETNMTNVLSIL